ncbi:hypothetical protein F4803DRAFT_532764 [Xylaria telfairii]|nr:hypothetical protein F4803DRAFT_532764 [Xylaria telfairii]
MALGASIANLLRIILNTAFFSISMLYAALRRLITSILCLFKSLFASKSYTRRVPSSQSHHLHRCHEELQKLINAQKQTEKSAVLFVALDVAFMDETQQKISAIGLSHRPPDRGSEVRSFHCIIGDPQDLRIRKASPEDEPFLYGTTEVIQEPDIGPSLHEIFSNLASRYRQIYLIGHGIEYKLDRLSNYWTAPTEFIVLDTQLLWKAQHNNTNPVSLEECIDTIGPLRDLMPSLNNVGNSAWAILTVLRYQEAELELS